MRYVRFTTSDYQIGEMGSNGLFATAYRLRESGGLDAGSRGPFDDALRWFEERLKAPRLPRPYRGALFWFRSECEEMLSRAWALAVVLQDYRIGVERHTTTDPGYICYEDLHQVAALPRHIARLRKPRVVCRSR